MTARRRCVRGIGLACALLVASASACGGAVPVGPGVGIPAATVTALPSAASPDPGSGITPPTLGSQPARLADRRPAPVDVPRRLVVPRLGLNEPVVPVGVSADGQLAVPAAAQPVSWYRHGPGLGSSGTIVLAGHVDFDGRRGVFWRLDELVAGDVLSVAGGTEQRSFRVESAERVDKAALPAENIFRPDGAARLVLITCGGAFDAATRSYRANVVVTAVPA